MDLKNVENIIPKIGDGRKYWLIRTEGGYFYEEFLEKNYVGFSFINTPLQSIAEANQGKEGLKALKETIKKKFPEDKRPGLTVNQMIKFTYEIKKNDVVLIPSENSYNISFGIVNETLVNTGEIGKMESPFSLRKSVKWIKTVRKLNLNPYLFQMFFSHVAIVDATDYGQFIESTISNLYVKDDVAHLLIKVKRKQEISSKDLFSFGYQYLNLFDEFCKENNLPYRSDDINLKINVQSPGFIAFDSESIVGIVLIGMILTFLIGGDFEVSLIKDVTIRAKTDGLIPKLINFINNRNKQKDNHDQLEQLIDKLDVKSPKEIVEAIKKLKE